MTPYGQEPFFVVFLKVAALILASSLFVYGLLTIAGL